MTFTLIVFEDDGGNKPFRSWLGKLSDTEKAAVVAACRTFLKDHGWRVAQLGMGRNLGGGLFEFYVEQDVEAIRARYTTSGRRGGPSEEVFLRIFCHAYGDNHILLLSGFNKGREGEKRQSAAIERARRMLEEFKRQQRRG